MSPPEDERPGEPGPFEKSPTTSDTLTVTAEMCWWCGRHERWRDPHHGDVPWSMCVHCYRAIVAGFRRRHDAALRMPLPDQRRAS